MDLKPHTLKHKRKCWEVVPYPEDGHHNFLRCHFVYKVKMKQGKVDRYKSRLVVDVVKYTTLRIFLAIAAVYAMQVHQLDVECIYLCPSGRGGAHASTPCDEHPSRPLHPTAQVSLWIASISTELEYIHTCMSSSHLLDSVAAHWTTVLTRALLMEL
jgi:hypothetical protein